MKVLLVSTWGYLRGGDARCLFDQERILEAAGHRVERFHMVHPNNRPARQARTFLPQVDWRRSVPDGPVGAAFALSRATWNRDAAARLDRVLRHVEPDVVHFHHVHHHLTPAVFQPLRPRRVPSVWTLHDYELLCPNGLLFTQGSPCERCRTGGVRQAVLHRCKRNSRAASLAAAFEQRVHDRLRIEDRVDAIACPSRFLRERVVAWGRGRPAEEGGRLHLLPHGVPDGLLDRPAPARAGADAPFLIVARLSVEKAVDVAIEAIARRPGARLVVLGDGPQRPELEALAERRARGRVEFRGHVDSTDVISALDECRALIVPSRWWENRPYVVLEAAARARAVLAADHGGLAELLSPATGRLHPPGDVAALAGDLQELADDPLVAERLGQALRAHAEREWTEAKFLARLLAIYAAIGVQA